MREIKFRAWDNQHQKFITSANEDPDCDGCVGLKFDTQGQFFTGDGGRQRKTRFIFEQFTGLYDKNGKEIYEGDMDSRGLVVVYDVGMSGYYLMSDTSGFHLSHSMSVIRGRLSLEIVGNVHENRDQKARQDAAQ